MNIKKNSIVIVLVCQIISLSAFKATQNIGISSLNQPCSVSSNVKLTDLFITTAETMKFNIYEIFEGNNLQISLTNNSVIQSNTAFQNGTQFVLDTSDLSIVSNDIYQFKSEILLLVDPASSNYYLQQWTTPNATVAPNKNGSLISLQNAMTTSCFSAKYLNEFTAVIDCEDVPNALNLLYFIDLSQSFVAQTTTTKLLHNDSLKANNRDMQIVIQNSNSMLYTYTEVVRLIGVGSIVSNILVKTLPPIEYPGTNNIQAISVIVNTGKFYILDKLSKEIYQITLDFKGITYVQQFKKIQLKRQIQTPLAMASSTNDEGSLFVVYKGIQNNQIFMEEINPNTRNNGPVYLIDPSAITINQILVGSHIIIVTYSSSNKSAFSVYLGQPYSMYQDQDLNSFGPMIYQQEINQTTIFMNSDENIMIATSNNAVTNVFSQSFWKIQIPEIVLNSATAGTSNVVVQCSSGYQSLNSTQNLATVLPAVSQANLSLTLNYVSPNFAKIIVSPFGIYKGSTTIPTQTLIISTPGQEVINLDQYYIASLLEYNIQLDASTISPVGWSQEKVGISKTTVLYQNTSFTFQTVDGNLIPGEIYYMKPYYVMPNYYLWIMETKSSQFYVFAEKEGENKTLFTEIGQSYNLIKSVSLFIQYEFLNEEQYVYAGIENPCLLNFLSKTSTQQYWSKTICDKENQEITEIKFIKKQLFIMINPLHNNMTSQIMILSPTNKTFSSSMEFNLMFFYAKQISGSYYPQTVYSDWQRDDIIFIQCKQEILIYDMYKDKFYPSLTLFATASSYSVAVTWTSLIIIQTQQIQEYSITDLNNIFKIRDQYPYYGSGTQSYQTGTRFYAYSPDLLYVYETTSKKIEIFRTGEDMPMIYMIYDEISLTDGLIYMFLTNQHKGDVEQLTVIGTNSLSIYNIHKRPLLTVKGYFNESIGQSTQTYSFQVQPISKAIIQPAPIQFKVTTTSTKFTNITFNNSNSLDFIQLNGTSATNILVNFNSFKFFQGTVNNYYLECNDYPQECNQTIFMQNPLGPEHIICNEMFMFTDVSSGAGNFSFAQTLNKIFRLTGHNNLLYDMVQLPFTQNPMGCTNIAVDELAQYSVSACTDFTNNGWNFYVSSYVSTEPHVIGSFVDVRPQVIERMVILDQYLFVIDADLSGTAYFNGIHIYQMNFNYGFGELDAQQFNLPSIATYLNTFKLNTTFQIHDVKSIDILHTSVQNQYRLFFSSPTGIFLNFVMDLTLPSENMILGQTIFTKNLIDIISSTDSDFKNLQDTSATFDSTIAGTKVFDFQNISNSQQYYKLILAFRYLNMYELSLNFAGTTILIGINNRYQKYAFYEFQNNIVALGGSGFILISGYLPSYLVSPQTNYSRHLFMAYDRTNKSQQQIMTSQKFPETYLMASYPFKTQSQFKYMAKNFTDETYAISLISPDNFTLFSYNLQRQAGIQFASTEFQTSNLQINAVSEFSVQRIQVSIHKDFHSSKSHPYWIIGVVLGPLAFIGLCVLGWWYRNKRKQEGGGGDGDKAGLLEDQ